MTVVQFANSPYAYMAFTIAFTVFGKRVLPLRTADLLTALLAGLWMGTVGGFWRGVATTAIVLPAFFALSFLVGLATGLWRIRRELLAKVLRR